MLFDETTAAELLAIAMAYFVALFSIAGILLLLLERFMNRRIRK